MRMIIDMHAHLRNDIAKHTKIAATNGISVVVYMANSQPPLDNPDIIKASLAEKRNCLAAIPVSAITKSLAGKELVEIEKIRHLVPAFSDDGKLVKDLGLLKAAFERKVPIWAHCSPPFEIGVEEPWQETIYAEQHIRIAEETKGILHIQHVSQRTTVRLIRDAKEQGVKLTCETAPHYCYFSRNSIWTKVNPPLADEEDIIAVREGLCDGTIDVIASDYAPAEFRITGMAIWRAFLPLCQGLVSQGVLTPEQLEDKLFTNPKRIIESGGYKLFL